MFYQLKSFDESLPDSVIATQAGLMASSFTGAEFLTAMMWGRLSDSERGGRKLVLMIGLLGTSTGYKAKHKVREEILIYLIVISCIGFGFSKTFWQALLFRAIGGALNGNVGVMRTMVSEIVQEKKFVLPIP
jgi:MFS family permease